MADIYIVDSGSRTFGNRSSATDIVMSVTFVWSSADGEMTGTSDSVEFSVRRNARRWQDYFLDALLLWAAANSHNVVRVVMADYTVENL